MKWSLFSWKKPAELAPGDYQQVKTNVNNNTTSITNLRNLLTTTQNDLNNVKANYLTTNTEQTITSLKTFRAAPVGLQLKQADGRVDKQYLLFKTNNDTTTFSLGSQLSETSFEVNRGDIKFQTQEANKKIIFDTPLVEFNRAVPQFGTEIKAGWGGGVCKFLPEDNSTKTLQFFETNNTSQRRFNLKVAEPTEANNPATKQYVDTKETAINSQINTLNTFKTSVESNISNINNEITNIKNTFTGLSIGEFRCKLIGDTQSEVGALTLDNENERGVLITLSGGDKTRDILSINFSMGMTRDRRDYNKYFSLSYSTKYVSAMNHTRLFAIIKSNGYTGNYTWEELEFEIYVKWIQR